MDFATYLTTLPSSQRAIRAKVMPRTGVFHEFTKAEIEQSIGTRFEKQVAQYPRRLAMQTRRYTLTYAELNQLANCVAHQILGRWEREAESREPVAILMEKDAPLCAAILGVLKSGHIYAPLDPSYPQTRLRHLVSNLGSSWVVTNSTHIALAREVAPDAQLLNIDDLDSKARTENPGLVIKPDDTACILFTSGSTGEPKGVVYQHRHILHSIMRHTNIFPIGSEDRLTLLSSISFVGAVRDSFGALLNGAALFPFDLNVEGIDALAPWLQRQRITMYRSVATVFRHFVQSLHGTETFPDLRAIKLGSETLYLSDIDLYRQHFSPDCVLFIGMGTTETGTAVQMLIDHDLPLRGPTVPAGYAAEDTEIWVLDENGVQLEDNQVGEIAIKSRYIALGYWQRPDLTQAAFQTDDTDPSQRIYRTGDLGRRLSDGRLEHLGRKDYQVKIRGSRVDVSEVETALLSIESVQEAVVMATTTPSGRQYLVAYVVPVPEAELVPHDLRRALEQALPAFMVPAVFVVLDTMPVTPSGKVDRKRLPAPGVTRPALDCPFVPPRTPVEQVLTRIWADILELDEVGVNDGFLELGGDSMLATQLLLRVRETCQVEVPLRFLLDAPTIAQMALVITQHQAEQVDPETLELMLGEVESRPED